MSAYLLIESGSASEGLGVHNFLETAAYLSQAGHRVDLFLIQNAVLLAVHDADPAIKALASRDNVSVWADDFSLRMRALGTGELAPGVHAVGMETLIDLLASGRKPIWH